MPGMMDTVLNLGLNDEVVTGLAAKSGERFAYDSYRRFLDMFGDVVTKCVFFFFFKFLKHVVIESGEYFSSHSYQCFCHMWYCTSIQYITSSVFLLSIGT